MTKRPYSEFMAALAMAGCNLPDDFGHSDPLPPARLREALETYAVGDWLFSGNKVALRLVLGCYDVRTTVDRHGQLRAETRWLTDVLDLDR